MNIFPKIIIPLNAKTQRLLCVRIRYVNCTYCPVNSNCKCTGESMVKDFSRSLAV